MKTPICDFCRQYVESSPLRLHMPGHKGVSLLGIEPLDLTEIDGADSLYEAEGIIRESEQNAGQLFGAQTFYSTEGSSLSIRAMLHLVCLYARQQGKRPLVLAGRNAHKTFISAAALLDFSVRWLYPRGETSYLSCPVTPEDLEAQLSQGDKPTAVYLTTPDYLGNMVDVASLARVCHRHGVLLAVDNAHGAYLKFLRPSRHPMDLGADLCCDSAHKTLPAVTGSAYLHISKNAPALLGQQAKNALALFGSTSPSYLILQSLDAVNGYLADHYDQKLADFIGQVEALKRKLIRAGFCLCGQEPLKLTLQTKASGYTGDQLARLLERKGLVCEFCDQDFLVLMVTPETGTAGLARLEAALLALPQEAPIQTTAPVFAQCRQVLTPRQAVFSPCEEVPVAQSVGRILASPSVGCPPAVPIVLCGERIDAVAAEAFAYYGIDRCTVVVE
ncbi:MAG: aminotransferase class V-fold PLP-dependent enzyme [Clostridia bacterium]|nr:aminotransferase class V-fold PLP-dependent enzyme [Clostridia bacterium]